MANVLCPLVPLGELVEVQCFSTYEVRLFRAAFYLALFGAFHISELVSPSRATAGGLGFEDVLMLGDSVECWICKSKLDQVGRGLAVFLRSLPGSAMCPVGVLREYLESRPSSHGPLFLYADKIVLIPFA